MRGRRLDLWRCAISAIAVAGLLTAMPVAAEDSEGTTSDRVASDTDRFYFYFETGHAGILDDHVAGDADFDTPDGINVVLGGGGGYNITDHWGVEIQGHGTEPDVRSKQYGKIKEFSNITIVGAARFRYPLGDDKRLVPYVTAGLGASLNEINDTGNPRIKMETDRYSLVGAIALGLDYFLADDVAVGFSMHTFIYPDVDTTMVVRDDANRIILDDTNGMNMTSISALAHLRVFPGQSAKSGERRLFFADHGPFDTGDLRFYLYLMGGHTELLSDEFADEVTMEAPGDFNATLGGGIGLNFTENWGAEIQLVNSEPNLNLSGIGKFAEISNFNVLPMVRFRWPLCGGRVVPFALAGVGVAFNDINDARSDVDQFGVGAVRAPKVTVQDTSVAASVGIGVEYFLNRHLSFGVSVPAYIFPDWDTSVRYNGTRRPGGGTRPNQTIEDSTNFTSIGGLLQVKVYLP